MQPVAKSGRSRWSHKSLIVLKANICTRENYNNVKGHTHVREIKKSARHAAEG